MEFCPDIKECTKVASVFDRDLTEAQYKEEVMMLCTKCQEEEKNG